MLTGHSTNVQTVQIKRAKRQRKLYPLGLNTCLTVQANTNTLPPIPRGVHINTLSKRSLVTHSSSRPSQTTSPASCGLVKGLVDTGGLESGTVGGAVCVGAQRGVDTTTDASRWARQSYYSRCRRQRQYAITTVLFASSTHRAPRSMHVSVVCLTCIIRSSREGAVATCYGERRKFVVFTRCRLRCQSLRHVA